MDIQALWIIVLSVATPVAGAVGFAFQLRQVKKARLENEKLQLEIAALKARAATTEQLIHRVTTEEVLSFAHREPRLSRKSNVLESRSVPGEQGERESSRAAYETPLKEKLQVGAFIFFVLFVGAYFIYDIYRLIVWVSSTF